MDKKMFSRPKPPCGIKESPPMVIHDISRLYAAKMRENESEMQQFSVRHFIINLSFEDGLTQLELAKRTHLSTPTISVTAKRLEKLGYITRVADSNDMRALRVFLTDRGRELVESSRRASIEADNILMQGFTAEESETLLSLLNRMRTNIERHLELEGD